MHSRGKCAGAAEDAAAGVFSFGGSGLGGMEEISCSNFFFSLVMARFIG